MQNRTPAEKAGPPSKGGRPRKSYDHLIDTAHNFLIIDRIFRCAKNEPYAATTCTRCGTHSECRLLHGCQTGQAKLTRGYRLPARFIIHTVGPVWHGGEHGERELLASCYRSGFALARSHGLRTLAFPAISCGVYRFPLNLAVEIALRETAAELRKDDAIEQVIFACFDETVYASYRRAAQQLSLEGIGLP